MSERMDELKGNVKEGVGKATGNERMEAEGKAEHDSAEARRKVKGGATEVQGHIEEGLGRVSGDEDLRERGAVDRLKGKVDRS